MIGLEEHERHRFLGEPDEDLVDGLEPDQLWSAVRVPVPRRRFSRAGTAAFWVLRAFLVVEALAVVYAFVAGVGHGS